ncbi:SEC14-like protein 2 [Trichoplax sp. H2]|nr:SEC14-like protein 2 [Trichoplax sp. H2]|eukprot:RDD46460.1 SEC14-like protein 2 [Trichoplax sp. H2]
MLSKLDVAQNEALIESLRFRRLWRLGDNLSQWNPPEVLRNYFPGGWLPGCDKDGHPIRIEPMGKVDMPGIIKSCQYSELIKFHAAISEKAEKVHTFLYTYYRFGRSRLGFSVEAGIVKPFLHSSADKIIILKDDYREELRKYIPVENIPVCYGGSLVDADGDEHCRQWITYGNQVPQNYYISDDSAIISAMKSKHPPLNLILDEFKERINDLMLQDNYDNETCMKWLKCYDFDLIQAEEMFRRNVEFKQIWRLDDSILHWIPPLVLQKYFPGGWLPGVDRDGHPVRLEPLGNIDFRGIMHSCTFSDLLRFHVKVAEENINKCKKLSSKAGRSIEGYTLIVDLKGLNRSFLWGPGITVFNEMLSLIANNYPSSLKVIYLIRSPPIFPVIYNLCKSFLGRDTAKVKLLGSDYKETLLKVINPNTLPKYYGGNLKDSDSDEKCSEWICYGGEVPHSYYINQNASLQDDLNWQNVVISAGLSFKAEYPVDVKGSIFRWKFRCKKHDIGFGVYFKKNLKINTLQNMKNLIPVERHSCRVIPERGSLYCEDVGIYALVFDNSYSYFNWKDVSYQIEIIEPRVTEDNDSKLTSDSYTLG